MLQYLTQRRVLIALAVLLFIACLLPPAAARWLSSKPRQVMAATVGLVSLPIKSTSDALRSSARLAIDRGEPTALQRNYDALLKYNADLIEQRNRALSYLALYQHAKQVLGLSHSPELVVADVTAWAVNGTRQTLTINQGASDGIKVRMVVADSDNFTLVGRITDVGPASATVELITTPGTVLNARFLPSTPTREPASITLPLKADASGRFIGVASRSSGAKLPLTPGYLAHLADDHWPAEASGLVIGKVMDVAPQPDNPLSFSNVVVQPIQPLRNLGRVVVLVPRKHS